MLFLPLIILAAFFSCQDEASEIINPEQEEIIDGSSTVANLMSRTATNDGSNDNIIDYANCLEVVLPVTVTANGVTITIQSYTDFEALEALLDAFTNDNDEVEITFPITVILNDYIQIIINNQEELEAQIENCNGENEADDDIECVDFQYPISFSIYNTDFQVIETITVDNDEALYNFLDTLNGPVLASLNFPVALILANGNTLEVNSNQELEVAIMEAEDDCDEDDDYDYNDDDECTEESIELALKECLWEITTYNNTDVFNDYYLDFDPNYGFVVYNQNGNVVHDGTWAISVNNDGSFIVDFDTNWQDLNGVWIIENCDNHDEFNLYNMSAQSSMQIQQDCGCNNPETLINDLIIYMPFANQVKDLISQYEPANTTNSFVEDRAGNQTCALAFTGNDTFEIPVNASNQLVQGDSFTISVWFKMQNTDAGDLEIFFRSPGNATQGFQLGVYDLNTPLFFDNLGTSVWDNDWNGEVDVVWENTDWHHLAVTVDSNNTIKFYRDGVQRNTIANSSFSIGSQAANSYIIGEGFVGHLDDLRVYKRTLNPNEINILYTLDAECYDCL